MTRKTPNAERITATLESLLAAADLDTLRQLVRTWAGTDAKIRLAALEFLQKQVTTAATTRTDLEGATALAGWDEIESDLAEFARHGCRDRYRQDDISSAIYALAEQLQRVRLAAADRASLLDQVCSHIRGGNTGHDDALYEIAHAASPTDSDQRDLAERLEAMDQNWPREQARRIYRRIDRQRYLELRALQLECGADFNDLATFFWEQGEREKAVAVARAGLEKATGSLHELRVFMAERAREAGDRTGFLELQFAEAVDYVSPERYGAFRALCSAEEWQVYEPRLLAHVAAAGAETRLRIHVLREEFAAAGALLATLRHLPVTGGSWFHGDHVAEAARTLEQHCPEQVLEYYRSGVPILRGPRERTHYAAIAARLREVRRVWVDILQQPDAWRAYAREIKFAHPRFPAFHEECARVLRDW